MSFLVSGMKAVLPLMNKSNSKIGELKVSVSGSMPRAKSARRSSRGGTAAAVNSNNSNVLSTGYMLHYSV